MVVAFFSDTKNSIFYSFYINNLKILFLLI